MIKEIKIKNFKCFDKFTIPMGQVSVLTGINGMGKSTVIQSLLLLRRSVHKNNGMKGLSLNGRYVSLGNAQDVLYEKADDEIIGLGFTDENGSYFWEYTYLPESDFLPVAKGDDHIKAKFFDSNRFSYLSAYRIQPQDLYRIQNEEEIVKREFGNNGEYALQYLGIHGDDQVENRKIILEDKFGETIRNQTRIWLDKVSPGVSPQVLVNMQLRSSELRYEFTEGRDKTGTYKSVNVGFGITYVLPLIITVLSARAGDIIVMENPEAHIHPAGQRMLGDLIARAGAGGVQIIVETHSDHILNGMRMAVKNGCCQKEDIKLSFFYKDKEDRYRHKCVHPQILQDGRLDWWPEGFFDEWDKALYELI